MWIQLAMPIAVLGHNHHDFLNYLADFFFPTYSLGVLANFLNLTQAGII